MITKRDAGGVAAGRWFEEGLYGIEIETSP
jgi:hypothetical protein